MTDPVEQSKKNISGAYNTVLRRLGLNPAYSDIYFTLFFANKPQGIKELSKATGYSVSTISNSMKFLESFFDIERSKQPGSKRVYFRCRHQFYQPVERILLVRADIIKMMLEVLREEDERLKNVKTEDGRQVLENIRNLKKDCESMDMIMNKVLEMQKELFKDKNR
ncbi:MAG: hypothetical protein V1921_02985 [Candidatus Altiarchaeota archaeon]